MDRTKPSRCRWSRKEYYRLFESGFFIGRRVELVFGEIVEMPPMKNEHAIALGLADDAVRRAFGTGHWVRIQMPLHLGKTSAPEPDLAVVGGGPRDYPDHPDRALLVIEVSDASLAYDRGRKAALYAHGGIEDYWIINLLKRTLEVRRSPHRARPARRSRYAALTTLDSSDRLAPLAAPSYPIAVADLLP
jgi:Uma2 family endonuclease